MADEGNTAKRSGSNPGASSSRPQDDGTQSLPPSSVKLLEDMGIPAAVVAQLYPPAWSYTVEQAKASQTSKERTTYLLSHLSDYVSCDLYDEQLLWQFLDDFEGWKQEDFAQATKTHSSVAALVKKQLQQRGIFLGRTYNVTLAKLIDNDSERVSEWPDEALCGQSDLHPLSRQQSRRQQLLMGVNQLHPLGGTSRAVTPAPVSSQQATYTAGTPPVPQIQVTSANIAAGEPISQQVTPDPTQQTRQQPQTPQSFQENQQKQQNPIMSHGTAPPQHPHNWQAIGYLWEQQYKQGITQIDPQDQPPTRAQKQPPLIPKAPEGDPADPIHYIQIPPLKVRQEMIDSSAAGTFSKLWRDSDNYTGEPYDVFDDKIKTFLQACPTRLNIRKAPND